MAKLIRLLYREGLSILYFIILGLCEGVRLGELVGVAFAYCMEQTV